MARRLSRFEIAVGTATIVGTALAALTFWYLLNGSGSAVTAGDGGNAVQQAPGSVNVNGNVSGSNVGGSGNTVNNHTINNNYFGGEPATFLLKPDRLPTPSGLCVGEIPSSAMAIIVGQRAVFYSKLGGSDRFNVFAKNGRPILKLERVQEEGIRISAQFLRDDGRRIVAVDRNVVDPNDEGISLNVETPSSHQIRITDGDREVFFAHFLNENTFVLRGEFFVPESGWVVAGDSPVLEAGGNRVRCGPCFDMSSGPEDCSAIDLGPSPACAAWVMAPELGSPLPDVAQARPAPQSDEKCSGPSTLMKLARSS